MTRRRDCLMTSHFLKWSFGPKIESVDGICQQTDSRNRFYLDVKTGNKGEKMSTTKRSTRMILVHVHKMYKACTEDLQYI